MKEFGLEPNGNLTFALLGGWQDNCIFARIWSDGAFITSVDDRWLIFAA
jgi:hypothetical protein